MLRIEFGLVLALFLGASHVAQVLKRRILFLLDGQCGIFPSEVWKTRARLGEERHVIENMSLGVCPVRQVALGQFALRLTSPGIFRPILRLGTARWSGTCVA